MRNVLTLALGVLVALAGSASAMQISHEKASSNVMYVKPVLTHDGKRVAPLIVDVFFAKKKNETVIYKLPAMESCKGKVFEGAVVVNCFGMAYDMFDVRTKRKIGPEMIGKWFLCAPELEGAEYFSGTLQCWRDRTL